MMVSVLCTKVWSRSSTKVLSERRGSTIKIKKINKQQGSPIYIQETVQHLTKKIHLSSGILAEMAVQRGVVVGALSSGILSCAAQKSINSIHLCLFKDSVSFMFEM